MRNWFREGFYGGLAIALLLGLFLVWLWRPEHQVRRHSDHLLRVMMHKDWPRFAGFIADDYQDQWGNNRSLLLDRTREVFRYVRSPRITAIAPNVRLEDRTGYWRAGILIEGDDNEVMAAIKNRINTLGTPFELEWRRMSAKPWDWKLVRVRNQSLEIPSGYLP
ncbi:MAG: hypothetical protein QOI34_301 [Verrucomicrobiota bacterium]